MMGGENLGDAAAAVVGDHVDLIEPQAVAERRQHLGLGGEGDVLVGGYPGGAMRHQIDGNAAAPVGDPIDDMPPEIAVQHHAMDEQRRRPFAPFRVGNLTELRSGMLHELAHDRLLAKAPLEHPTEGRRIRDRLSVCLI